MEKSIVSIVSLIMGEESHRSFGVDSWTRIALKLIEHVKVEIPASEHKQHMEGVSLAIRERNLSPYRYFNRSYGNARAEDVSKLEFRLMYPMIMKELIASSIMEGRNDGGKRFLAAYWAVVDGYDGLKASLRRDEHNTLKRWINFTWGMLLKEIRMRDALSSTTDAGETVTIRGNSVCDRMHLVTGYAGNMLDGLLMAVPSVILADTDLVLFPTVDANAVKGFLSSYGTPLRWEISCWKSAIIVNFKRYVLKREDEEEVHGFHAAGAQQSAGCPR